MTLLGPIPPWFYISFSRHKYFFEKKHYFLDLDLFFYFFDIYYI